MEYGGDGMVNDKPIEAEEIGWDYKDYSIGYKLGAFGVCIFKFDYVEPKKPEPVIDETELKITEKKTQTKKTATRKKKN